MNITDWIFLLALAAAAIYLWWWIVKLWRKHAFEGAKQ